ncbi:S49 family peptidase [Spirosoma sp.]|uniref:S49 family peptidase n=1 Tax=Spirosoma sp. TaxID=1899569 RepID=UPI00260E641C|nr:S49 family peptidase [Spirosoma sp.]
MRAGRDAVPPSMRGEHPSAFMGGREDNRPQAGTSGYYEYFVDAYAKRTGGEVPIIPVIGPLSRYGACSWGYEDLTGLMQAADRMPSTKAIVLETNTPGGGVDGLKAFAESVRATSKPVVVWTPFCASAGYYFASQADEIILEDQSVTEIGSIGVIMIYANQARALEKAGIDVRIFRSDGSEKKAPLNGIEPLSEETIASIQSSLNDAKREFHGYVRRGRAGLLTSDEWTSADMFSVKDALKIGLADAKGSLDFAVKRALQLAKQS